MMILDESLVGENVKLKNILEFIEKNKEIKKIWECQNINAIDRLKLNDHGPTHIKIVASNALKILKILKKFGITTNIEKDYKMSPEDGEIVVVLASLFHDAGLVVSRENHELISLIIANHYLDKIIRNFYNEEEALIIKSEILTAIYSHSKEIKPLTLEAAIVKLADGLDMEKGRARIPFKLGAINIHSVSALAIEKVDIEEGNKDKPIIVRVVMRNSAGIFQITELLKNKIKGTLLESYVKIIAEIKGETEAKIIDKFEI